MPIDNRRDILSDDTIAPHRADRPEQAQAVAEAEPQSVPARLDYGDLLAGMGRYREAEAQFREVLRCEPEHFRAHARLADMLRMQGDPDDAADHYRIAIGLAPEVMVLRNNLGLALMDSGRLAEAETEFRQAIAGNPTLPDAYNNLGNLLRLVGKVEEAVVQGRRAVSLHPDDAGAHTNLANALRGSGQPVEAEEHCRRAAALAPADAALHGNLAAVLMDLGRYPEAEEACRAALALDPGCAGAHNNLATIITDTGRIEEGLDHYRRALALDPSNPAFHADLANALRRSGQHPEAEAAYRAALALDPNHAGAHCNLAILLSETGRVEEGLEHSRQAFALDPDHVGAHCNLGFLLSETGRNEEAIRHFREAIRLRPDYPEFHFNLGWTLLRVGEFEAGWVEYEWRFKMKHGSHLIRSFSQPLWDGSALGSRKLLLHAEQGYGDTLQFCRFVPQLGRQAHIVLAVQQPLIRLLSGLPDVAEIAVIKDDLPPFDVQCPLLSLPRLLGTRLETIPGEVPYLRAEPERAAFWRRRLNALDGLRVGLVWAGSSSIPAADRQRSIGLDALASLGSIEGVSFVSLQKHEDGRERPVPCEELTLHDWTDELHDFAETAALIDGLDLVIAVDTSVVHLAGALGKPVWLLNRFNTCWRWLLDRDDSPWYPTLRQFRQPSPGDWPSVIREVREAIENRVRAMPAPNRPRRR